MWTGPRRVPLGEPYEGSCLRTPSAIPMEDQASLCNFGYVRGRCAHFLTDAADAIRFSMSRGEFVWIEEREHAPVSHGGEAAMPDAFTALARAFLETHRKRASK